MTTPYIQATRWELSLLPFDAPNAYLFKVSVEWRGHAYNDPNPPKADPVEWAVVWMGYCLSKKNEWDYEPLPSSRSITWIRQHRFTYAEAMKRAEAMLPLIEVNDMTALVKS